MSTRFTRYFLLWAFLLGAATAIAAPKTAEEAFARRDKDGDGQITREEFVGKREGEAAAAAEARFDKLDQNSDGAVSFEEFNAFVAVTLSFASARTPEKAFAKKDGNGDGRISRVEFIGSRVGEKAARAGRRFDKLDQDQDGALTLGEWKADSSEKEARTGRREAGCRSMPASHRHRFIFIKTRKTVGTSIEISLSRFCDGPNDVVTPLSPVDERFRRSLGVRPKNFRREAEGGERFRNHSRAARVRSKLGEVLWNGYTTFCFTRNPWDRVVSQYCFRHAGRRNREPVSFEDFVGGKMFTREFLLYGQRGEILVDHVARFEDLEGELGRITSAIGLDWDGWLPHAKGGFRPPGVHYSEYYTPELVAIVERRCRKEIELQGYRFEPAAAAPSTTDSVREAAADR